MSIYERKRNETKRKIETAFYKLLEKKSYSQISISDIAKAAEINRGTFYQHYRGKQDLLDIFMEERLRKIVVLCSTSKIGSRDNLELIIGVFELLEEDKQFYLTIMDKLGTVNMRKYFSNMMSVIMREYVSTSVEEITIDKEILIKFLSEGCVGIFEWWFKNNMPYTPRIMGYYIFELIANIFRSEWGYFPGK